MENAPTQVIAAKVASAIKASPHSQRSVAREAGIPTTTFDRKIHGHTDFYLVELLAIARILGVTLGDFLPTGTPLTTALAT